MKKRQYIIIGVALLILFAAKLGKDALSTPEERKKPAPKEQVVSVFTEVVELKEHPILISTTGMLMAKDRMELYSEVQGMMLPDNGRFKAGNRFQKGQVLLSIRSDDARASVISQRSIFERNLSSVMADIRLDYPTSYADWSAYLRSIDVSKSLPELPAVSDPKLKSYLTGRDIFTSYYNVRNAEIGLSRYTIYAPYSGVLTSALVDPGTVIRQGQLLGVFIRPVVFELQASIDSRSIAFLKKGHPVTLMSEDGTKRTYTGTVSRVNLSIDPNTQMSDFFVEVRSSELKEGEFFNVVVRTDKAEDTYEIDRSALKDSKYAYIVENGQLRTVELEIVHFTEQTAIVRGIENGQEILTRLPPSAFDGMKVKVYTESTEQ